MYLTRESEGKYNILVLQARTGESNKLPNVCITKGLLNGGYPHHNFFLYCPSSLVIPGINGPP